MSIPTKVLEEEALVLPDHADHEFYCESVVDGVDVSK